MSTNAEESIIRDLEQRQAELEESIQSAVRIGAESINLRQELKTVQSKLQTARTEVATMQATGRQAADRIIAKAGDEQAGAAVDRIIGGAAPFAEILTADAPAIDFTGAPAVIAAAHNVASARQRVTEAETEHAVATADVSDLTGKIAAKRERLDELTRKSIAGEAGEGSHAERYAINEDVQTLDIMHARAKSKADNLMQPIHDARIHLKNAEAQAAKVEHRLTAEHLAAHAKALESAYIACLRACEAEGAKAGVGIGALLDKSLELRTWVGSGVVMKPFGRA